MVVCGVELVCEVQQLCVHLSTLSSAVSLSMKLFFQPVDPAERFVLNGEVTVKLTKVCSLRTYL